MSKLSIDKRIRLSEKNLERVNLWIFHADKKVGAALLLQAGLIAFLTSTKADDVKQILLRECNYFSFILLLLLLLFLFFLVRAGYHSFRALYPDVKIREGSLFFFCSIDSLGATKFKKEFSTLTEEEAEEDLNNQVIINSQIATIKFQNIKKSIIYTGLATIFWILGLIIIPFLI